MKQLFKQFIGWWKNDWETKYMQVGTWNISGWDDWDQRNYKEQKYCRYYFEYSKYLNKWRLRGEGHDWRNHGLYTLFTNEFNEYVNTISDPVKFERLKISYAIL